MNVKMEFLIKAASFLLMMYVMAVFTSGTVLLLDIL